MERARTEVGWGFRVQDLGLRVEGLSYGMENKMETTPLYGLCKDEKRTCRACIEVQIMEKRMDTATSDLEGRG